MLEYAQQTLYQITVKKSTHFQLNLTFFPLFFTQSLFVYTWKPPTYKTVRGVFICLFSAVLSAGVIQFSAKLCIGVIPFSIRSDRSLWLSYEITPCCGIIYVITSVFYFIAISALDCRRYTCPKKSPCNSDLLNRVGHADYSFIELNVQISAALIPCSR